MKIYFIKLQGITVEVDADGLNRWAHFLLDNGHTPIIEKVEEAGHAPSSRMDPLLNVKRGLS